MRRTIRARTAAFTLVFGALAGAGGWAGTAAHTGDLLASEAGGPASSGPVGPAAPAGPDCGCDEDDGGASPGDG